MRLYIIGKRIEELSLKIIKKRKGKRMRKKSNGE